MKTDLYNYFLYGIKTSEPLSVIQIKTIFVLALYDYLHKNITIYDLENIAGDLYFHCSGSPDAITIEDQQLSYMLDIASDSTYYQKHDMKKFEEKRSHLESYLEENNYIVEIYQDIMQFGGNDEKRKEKK